MIIHRSLKASQPDRCCTLCECVLCANVTVLPTEQESVTAVVLCFVLLD